MTDSIAWEGDPADEQFARWKGLVAHVERLDEEDWYAGVWLKDKTGDDWPLHSTTLGIGLPTVEAARWLCEQVMRREFAERQLAGEW